VAAEGLGGRSVRMCGIGRCEDASTFDLYDVSAAEVHIGWGVKAEARVTCSWLYQWKKRRQNARPSSTEPNRPGNSGRYLSVLNCASEYGLSFEQCGREWLLVTPRSASNRPTGLEAIDVPRSAWIVSWSAAMSCLRMVSPSSRSALSFLTGWVCATSHESWDALFDFSEVNRPGHDSRAVRLS
jgi:hypothetical protein